MASIRSFNNDDSESTSTNGSKLHVIKDHIMDLRDVFENF